MRPTNREMRRPQIKVGIYEVQEKGAVNFQIRYLHKFSNTDGMAVAKSQIASADKVVLVGIRHFNSDLCLVFYHQESSPEIRENFESASILKDFYKSL